jgi:hypothetical protein
MRRKFGVSRRREVEEGLRKRRNKVKGFESKRVQILRGNHVVGLNV